MLYSIHTFIYICLVKLLTEIHGITYLRGISTPKYTTRKIPLEKWLENNNLRLAPYGNKEFTKIFRQYKEHVRAKYYYVDENATDTSLGKYVRSLFFTSTLSTSRKPKKKEKIKMGKLKLVKENIEELEEKLEITTIPPSTTTQPTTTPYTGPTQRKSASPYFDPDYIYDVNWFLKPKKRLKRNLNEVCENKANVPNELMSKLSLNEVFINQAIGDLDSYNNFKKIKKFPVSHVGRVKINFAEKRGEEYDPEVKNSLDGESDLNRLKRELQELKYSYELKNAPHAHEIKRRPGVRVKRSFINIARRSTKRPHLSRKFKSQSKKRHEQEMFLSNMLKDIRGNITIAPEFKNFKHVMDELERNNLSTLFYVYNNVAYLGSVPPHVLINFTTTEPTKKVTYELGATQILSADIFNEKKVSPDVEIPNINIDHRDPSNNTERIEEDSLEKNQAEVISEESITKKKEKRSKKMKSNKKETNGTHASETKKTRSKRKTTLALDPSDENLKLNKSKTRKRKARSLNSKEQLFQEMLPHFLFLLNAQHKRFKRDTNENKGKEEETQPKLEDGSKKSNLSPFAKLKEAFQNSKHHISSFVREKKENLVDMPRRAKYIAREMYLDGKFFISELQHIPSRIKIDFQEKKEYFGLFMDIFKILMPATEVGEKGGTTPEPKIVDDPKRYVKNPEDYLTPDISMTTKTTFVKREAPDEVKTKASTKNIVVSERDIKVTTTTPTMRMELNRRDTTTEVIILNNDKDRPSARQQGNEPRLVETEELSVKKQTYVTKILDPDFETMHTRFGTDSSTKTTSYIQAAFNKVNDEKVFDDLQNTMKNKEKMDTIFNAMNKDRLKTIMQGINPADILKTINKDTLGRMGNLMKDIHPDTLKKMQEMAVDIYAPPKPSGSPGPSLVSKTKR